MRAAVLLCLTAMMIALAPGCGSSSAQPLFDYVQRPDPAFAWEQTGERTVAGVRVVSLSMTSQVWQGLTWTHRMQIVVPPRVGETGAGVLLITGGSPGEQELVFLALLAAQAQAPLVVLGDIPNQPLYGGLYEDHLIAHTFLRYLETRDESWPLLFPMTKAAVRAMDAAGAWSAAGGGPRLERFVVTGASKRGWTTWLTAAVDSERVIGLAPMVYDNLNLPAQMAHQLAAWGAYSPSISEYTETGLTDLLQTPEGRRLGAIVDPYTYRSRLTMPKLSIIGTNDSYWPLDAAGLYYPDLPEPRYLLYVPNAGHGLEDRDRVARGIVGFFAMCTGQAPQPRLTWRWEQAGHVKLIVSGEPLPLRVEQWTATAPDRDFRPAQWTSREARRHGEEWVCRMRLPESGYAALFAEVTYEVQGRPMPLSTEVRVFGPQG